MGLHFTIGASPDGTIHMEHQVINVGGKDFNIEEYKAQVRRCVEIGQTWKRVYGELNRLFGIAGHHVGDPENLVRLLQRSCSHDVRDRCIAIEKIAEQLQTRHPDNPAAQLTWLTTPHPDFAGEPPILLMVYGKLSGLQEVAQYTPTVDIGEERSGC